MVLIPRATSRLFLGAVVKRLDIINEENFETYMPRQVAAPAATALVPTLVNGAVGSTIPDNRIWAKALTEEPMTNLLL